MLNYQPIEVLISDVIHWYLTITAVMRVTWKLFTWSSTTRNLI